MSSDSKQIEASVFKIGDQSGDFIDTMLKSMVGVPVTIGFDYSKCVGTVTGSRLDGKDIVATIKYHSYSEIPECNKSISVGYTFHDHPDDVCVQTVGVYSE